MARTVSARVIEQLSAFPDGLRTEQLSQRLRIRPQTMSSKLSRMFQYGEIGRAHTTRDNGRNETIWKVDADA